jgi:hypothetical protein
MQSQKEDNNYNSRPKKRARLESEQTKEKTDDQLIGSNVEYAYAKEMRLVLQNIKKEIDLHSSYIYNSS